MNSISVMRGIASVFAVLCVAPVWALSPTNVALPPVAHADTEVVTNVVFSSWQRGAAKFAFSLSFLATPSNNVEAAFGKDANANGVLEPEETDLVVGWNRGNWFVQNGTDGERFSGASTSMEDVKTLAWNYRLTAAPTPARLSVMLDGTAAFPTLSEDSPEWLHRRKWNLMRLTGRGLHDSGEVFTIGTSLDPTAILFR